MVENIVLSDYWKFLYRGDSSDQLLLPLQLQESALLLKLQSGGKSLSPLGHLHQIAFLPGAGYTFFARHPVYEGLQTIFLDSRFLYRVAIAPYSSVGLLSISVWRPNGITL